MFDCHTHLYDDQYALDLNQVLARAKDVGVKKSIVVSEDMESAIKVLKMCDNSMELAAGIGIHPCSVNVTDYDNQYLEIKTLIEQNHKNICCIGEVGLDFTPNIMKSVLCKFGADTTHTIDDLKKAQREVLRLFVDLSLKYDLTLNVHSRSAGRPTIQLLKECKAQKVLLHCFDGSTKVAMDGIRSGYFFSVPANVKRSKQMQDLVAALPISQLLLETDSPALPPTIDTSLDKQERNEPANIIISAETIAEIKNISVDEVIRQTSINAINLFKL
ncbi:deoxyribonuclease TATDN [Acrasis kona]|uniref:Deoxyribonuclease TATDN n=1 Tax=Acrasis kona TaxID=1008807 RepID=A0AAW2Z993_9EUKA